MDSQRQSATVRRPFSIVYADCDPPSIINEVRVGDMIIASVSTSRGTTKNVIGIIQSLADNDYEVQFLKECSQSIYMISDTSDVAWVQKSDIRPVEVDYTIDSRDRYIFSSPPK